MLGGVNGEKMNFRRSIYSGFKNYVKFTGRATRSEYWYWCLFIIIGSVYTIFVDAVIIEYTGERSPIYEIFYWATFIPGLAVSGRRLHDVNRSGWWLFIALTGIGMLVLLYWFVQPSSSRIDSPIQRRIKY